jgi:hypothetical protein
VKCLSLNFEVYEIESRGSGKLDTFIHYLMSNVHPLKFLILNTCKHI